MGEAAKTMLVTLSVDELERLVEKAVSKVLANTNASPLEYLTAEQVAEKVGVCAATVGKWSERDGLPCMREGRVIRYRLEDVRTWLASRVEKPGAHASKHVARLRRIGGE